ncbi:MAG: SDR family NAD(P)-dependent oxidoreductase [Chthoniobacter sp.]
MLIAELEAHSPAARAGLKRGDIIVGFKGHAIRNIDDLHKRLVASEIGVPLADHGVAPDREDRCHGHSRGVATPAKMSALPKVALVTGAYKGIGLEVVRQLAARGVRVYLTARQREAVRRPRRRSRAMCISCRST